MYALSQWSSPDVFKGSTCIYSADQCVFVQRNSEYFLKKTTLQCVFSSSEEQMFICSEKQCIAECRVKKQGCAFVLKAKKRLLS